MIIFDPLKAISTTKGALTEFFRDTYTNCEVFWLDKRLEELLGQPTITKPIIKIDSVYPTEILKSQKGFVNRQFEAHLVIATTKDTTSYVGEYGRDQLLDSILTLFDINDGTYQLSQRGLHKTHLIKITPLAMVTTLPNIFFARVILQFEVLIENP